MHLVFFKKSARKELEALQGEIRDQVAGAIKSLAENPHPRGAVKLKTFDGYRVRSGDYRILYTVDSTQVIVYSIGHRKDVYR